MLMRHSIAVDNMTRTIPPIDEGQKVALLHAPFKGTTLFVGELEILSPEEVQGIGEQVSLMLQKNTFSHLTFLCTVTL